MSRVPELYDAAADEAARAENRVYVADVIGSHVLTALKIVCAPQGLGFLHAQSVDSPEADAARLGSELRDGISRVRRGELDMIYLPTFEEIMVYGDYQDPAKVTVQVKYWDGRPVQTSLTTGGNFDEERLTGFVPFSPSGFDRDQGRGVAQQTIDALRATGHLSSFEVAMNAGAREFDTAKAAELLAGRLRGEPDLATELSDRIQNYLGDRQE
jgi:hypothetical protein